jgi:hypothetical protein
LAVYILKAPTSLDFSVFIYQARDLFRIDEIIQGTPIFYGPEMFGGGHLPGPFYYLMYLLPYHYGGIEAVASWHYIYYSIAVSVLCNFAYKRWGRISALIILILLCFSIFHRDQLYSNFNPSASPIFQVLILILILKLKDKWSSKHWFLLCTIINLSLQIHFSFILFYIYVLFVFRKQKKTNIIYGLAASSFVLLPYFFGTIYCSTNSATFCPMETVGNVGDGFSFLSLPFTGLVSLEYTDVISNIVQFIHRVYFDDYILLGGSVLLLFYFLQIHNKKSINDDKTVILHLFLLSHFGHIWNLFSGMVFMRYLQHYYFFLIVLIGFSLPKLIAPLKKKKKPFLFGSLLTYCLVVLGLIQIDRKIVYENNSNQVDIKTTNSNMYYKVLKNVLSYIQQETNWDYSTFSRRTYWIGLNHEEDKSLIYRELALRPVKIIKKENTNFGFIIAKVDSKADFEKSISQLIKTTFDKKQIRFRDLKIIDKIVVIKYFVDPEASIPKLFGNLGFHYILPEHIKALSKYYSKQPASKVIKTGKSQWRGCWDCKTSNWKNVDLNLSKIDVNQHNIKLNIDGISLSSPDAVTPLATQRLENITLQVECSDKTLILPIGSIGGLINDEHKYKYFSAPYQNNLIVDCKKINKVVIGFQKLIVIRLLEHWTTNKYHESFRAPIIFNISLK